MHPTDKELVERLLAGDRTAFREFFDSYFPRLYRFAASRVNRDPVLAEEIVQTAMCRAVNRLDSYRGEGPLFSWLCTFCRHEVSNHFRRLRRAEREVALVEESPEVQRSLEAMTSPRTYDPECALRQDELDRRVHATLDNLPSRYGDVLEWKYAQGLSVRQIAERLEIGEKAAESMLTRARRAFREAFEEVTSDGRRPDGLHRVRTDARGT